jgi:hypothetical protein
MEQRKLYWLHFARFCSGALQLNKRNVDLRTRENSGYDFYRKIAEAVSKVASTQERDYEIIRKACNESGLNAQASSAIIGSLEKVIDGQEILVVPKQIKDYPIEMDRFRVPISYNCVWKMKNQSFFIKYQFASTSSYRATVEDLKIYLALSSLQIPLREREIHPTSQLLLFEDGEYFHDPEDLDFWAFKFQGIDDGLVFNTPDEVHAMQTKIVQTSKTINDILTEVESFLDH